MWGNFWVHVWRLPPPAQRARRRGEPYQDTEVARPSGAPLAIRDMAGLVCDVCGGEATVVCSHCSVLSDGSLLCDDCKGR